MSVCLWNVTFINSSPARNHPGIWVFQTHSQQKEGFMRFGGLGPWEIMVIVGLALLIFGPKRLPDLGKSLAEGIKNFKQGMKAVRDTQAELKAEVKKEV